MRETGRGGRERERTHGLTAVSTEGERGPRDPDGLQEVTGRDRRLRRERGPETRQLTSRQWTSVAPGR